MKQVDRLVAQIDYLMSVYFTRHKRKSERSIQKSIHVFLKRDARLQRELPPGLTIVRAARPLRSDAAHKMNPYRTTYIPPEKPKEK